MTSGRSVVSARYEKVAMPKVKAIGTPIITQAATSTTKNKIRLPWPIAISNGCASDSPSAIAPTRPTAKRKPRHVVVSSRRRRAMIAVNVAPTRIATTR